MLSIGELSRVTQLSIKALRLYHEKGILIPNKIDMDSKYRYYHRSAVEKGLIIRQLRELGFTLQEIGDIISSCSDDDQLAVHAAKRLTEVNQKLQETEQLKNRLTAFLESAHQEGNMKHPESVQQVEIEEQIICSIRFKGRYDEVGSRFSQLFKSCGRHPSGKPFSLYYDDDYKEEGADIEACVPVKKELHAAGMDCRKLAGGRAVTLIHRGPYHELGRSYMRLFEYCREYGLDTALPSREQYIKGPGMIFKGNPAKYVTRLVMLLKNG